MEQSVTPNGRSQYSTGNSLLAGTGLFAGTNRLPELIPSYIQIAHELQGHTKATQRDYRVNLMAFCTWLESAGHSLMLEEVAPNHILLYFAEKKSLDRSNNYIRSIYQHLNTFFNWCLTWELLQVSPMARIQPPKRERRIKPFLKAEQIDALLSLCPPNTFLGSRRRSLILILLTTGMRHMEVHNLMLADLDFNAIGGLIRVRQGKGQKDRLVPFARDAQQAVLRYLAHRNDDYPHLWITEERKPLSYAGIGQDMKELMTRAGINVKDRLHIFRRTFAVNAERQGIPRQYTLAVAGWESEAMLDYYTRQMRAEAEALEAFQDFSPFG